MTPKPHPPQRKQKYFQTNIQRDHSVYFLVNRVMGLHVNNLESNLNGVSFITKTQLCAVAIFSRKLLESKKYQGRVGSVNMPSIQTFTNMRQLISILMVYVFELMEKLPCVTHSNDVITSHSLAKSSRQQTYARGHNPVAFAIIVSKSPVRECHLLMFSYKQGKQVDHTRVGLQ
jgi:hypothetical protein